MADDGSPRVSIGLPVYNGGRYLKQALDSLLGQTFDDFELIISDNCSSDDTEAICREYAGRDTRIRYIRQQQNLGSVGNFNFVFSKARGEYFKWAAHDDLCEPTFIESCVRVLDEQPNVVWCHCESDKINELDESWLKVVSPEESDSVERTGNQLHWVGHPRPNHNSRQASRRFAGVLRGTTWAVDSYALIRSDALRKTRMFLPHYGAEKILIGELSLQGTYYHIPDCLFAQRIHHEASGNLQSSRSQAAFAVGSGAKSFLPTRVALLFGHLGAVMRAEISVWQRIRCLAAVLRYLLQVRKWKQILGEAILGRGVGSEGYHKTPEQSDLIHHL